MAQLVRFDPRPQSGQRAFPTDLVWPDKAIWLEREWLHFGGIKCRLGSPTAGPESERRYALFSIAFSRPLAPQQSAAVEKAVAHIFEGDPTLANVRLAHAGLSRLPIAGGDLECIPLADAALADGLPAAILMRTVFANCERPTDEDPADAHTAVDEAILTKFDPDQPRVPAGSGPESGRRTKDSASSGSNRLDNRARTATALALPGASLLLPEVGAGTIAALSAFAAGVGLAAVFGFLFVPTPSSQSSEGALPGSSGARYTYNHDEGRLRIQNADGALLAQGQRDRNGVFHDFETGVPFAHEVDGALVFDGDAVREDPDTAAIPRVVPQVDDEEDEPKLCPAPTEDRQGAEAASDRAKAYQ